MIGNNDDVRRFDSVLIANRGEIAVRIVRACRELELTPIGIYAASEEHAPHVRMAEDAYRLPDPDSVSPGLPYLNIPAIIEIAKRSGAGAVHPGYGFLAENSAFAQACRDAGLIFVGPSPSAIRSMGDKVEARRIAIRAGVPVVPGSEGPVDSVAAVAAWADANGYPLAIKAAGGGGGRGFRVAHTADELADAFDGASGEATRFFANPTVYVERYVSRPRHVEIQLMADHHGHVVSLGERDCSIQRRHQKLIEESPSPAVDAELRAAMSAAAIGLATEVGYVGAGTVEFLLDEERRYFFLEMNTRIQVEHPVTEMVTGIDLVREQLTVAMGQPLSFSADDVEATGHAIECRINAEDTGRGFAPAPGTITTYREPGGFSVRVDAAMEPGGTISPAYDSMIAKLVTWGRTRSEAISRMSRALAEFEVGGVATTIAFHRDVMRHAAFIAGDATTAFLTEYPEVIPTASTPSTELPDQPEAVARELVIEVNGRRVGVRVHGLDLAASASSSGQRHPQQAPRLNGSRNAGRTGSAGPDLLSPIQGTLVRLAVEDGQQVVQGQVIAVVEAMKMENEVSAHRDGTVNAISVSPGISVSVGTVIARIED